MIVIDNFLLLNLHRIYFKMSLLLFQKIDILL